jgi:molecular chaperone DnaJ
VPLRAAFALHLVQVVIPAGVDTGMNLRLAGRGESGQAGPGSLYIFISVAEHPIFERDGADIHLKVRLTLREALLGSTVTIPTLDGQVSVKTPAGMQSGDRRVITGRGVALTDGCRKGHQYVHFEVMMPRNLSERQRELIEHFAEDEVRMSEEERTHRRQE